MRVHLGVVHSGIGDVHRWRLLSILAFFFVSFCLVGFATPRDPRVTAIVVPTLGGEPIEAAAHRHLTRPDGVVLYVALAEHRTRIDTGPEARKLLTDSRAQSILDERVRPLLREGRTDAAVDAGVAAIEDALQPAPSTTRLSPLAWVACGVGIAGLLLLFASAANAAAPRRKRRSKSDAVDAPPIDTSGSGGGSGGGGASSGW